MRRRDLIILALLLPAGCTAISLLIFWLSGNSFATAFSGAPFRDQAAWGLIIGAGVAALANAIEFNTEWFRELRRMVEMMFVTIRPTRFDLMLVAAGAGWGEELLFRGALQPIIGIWPAAVAFALAHGLMTKPSWGRLAYTAVLLFAGAGLGYLARWQGLWAAMIAHAVYDFVVLLWAHHLFCRNLPPAQENTGNHSSHE